MSQETFDQCPACHQPCAISVIQKGFLGPARSVPCRHCGARLTISLSSVLRLITISIGLTVVLQFVILTPDLSVAVALLGMVALEWLHISTPLVPWTPEHEAKAGLRPSVPLKALLGGVLGVATALALMGAFGLQTYALPIIVSGLLIGSIGYCRLHNWRTVFSISLGALLCIIGAEVVMKYREADSIRDVRTSFEKAVREGVR